jgi:hypothetical protein
MSDKLELLESKVRKVIEELIRLRRENERLKSESESLKSQIALTTGEGRKAQRLLAEYDQMKRSHDQAVGRVERALQKLNSLRLQ